MDESKDSSSNNSSVEKMEEVMLPGFRFHPTDEELVGFYLRRKIQHRPLSIELIKQLDIYKYDPWDLPKMATTGEKEWYFYCPRDRKYRNSARPNRVTGAGFWKATGTDRPIYSSESSKCIGLKKSLVFYKGRAAKGIKTDWMMHEFRLPSSTINTSNNESGLTKRYMDKHIPLPANDAWAICRIFKKANSTAQRALSQSWVSPIILTAAETSNDHPMQTSGGHYFHTTTTKAAASSSVIQFGESSSSHEVIQQQQKQSSSSSSIPTTFSPTLLDPTYNFPYTKCSMSPVMMMMMMSDHDHDQGVSHHEVISTSKCHHDDDIILNTTITPFPTTSTTTTIDASSLLLNMSSSVFGDMGKSGKDLEFGNTTTNQEQYCSNFLMAGSGQQEQDVVRRNYFVSPTNLHDQTVGAVGEKDKEKYWDSCMQSLVGDLLWDSSSPCPSSDISTTYSTNNKCYT